VAHELSLCLGRPGDVLTVTDEGAGSFALTLTSEEGESVTVRDAPLRVVMVLQLLGSAAYRHIEDPPAPTARA
jgi:hypothetical protein